MKKLKIQIPNELELREAQLIEYDAEFKECIVEVHGAWKYKQKMTVTLDEIFIAED